jgi:hypothetical protein
LHSDSQLDSRVAGIILNCGLRDAGSTPPLPQPQGRPILPAHLLESFSFYATQTELGKMQIVDVNGEPFQWALRVQTLPGALGEYNVTAIAPVAGFRIRDWSSLLVSGCVSRKISVWFASTTFFRCVDVIHVTDRSRGRRSGNGTPWPRPAFESLTLSAAAFWQGHSSGRGFDCPQLNRHAIGDQLDQTSLKYNPKFPTIPAHFFLDRV